jgi:elongation factor Tu
LEKKVGRNTVQRSVICGQNIMAKEEYYHPRPELNVITFGQLDHGKTTLTAAIMKLLSEKELAEPIDMATLLDAPEEGKIGARFHVTRVNYLTETRYYTHVDCPNHMDCVKFMIADSSPIDGAILVVAATDGVMPQMKEQILLAKQTGIPKIVVFLNKADMVENAAMLESVQMAITGELEKHGFGDSPVIVGSALGALNGDARWVASIDQLMDTIDAHIPAPVEAVKKPFLMSIEDVVGISDSDAVATGRIEAGIINMFDEVIVFTRYGDVKLVAARIEKFKRGFLQAEVGDNVNLLLRSVDKIRIHRGATVTLAKDKGLHQQYKKFKSLFYVSTREDIGNNTFFTNSSKSQLFFRTFDIPGSVTLPPDITAAQPGDYLTVTVELLYPVIMAKGLCFFIRDSGRTIGAGLVIELIS